MSRIGNLREAFDADCDFTVVKPLTYGGTVFGPGQPFDKSLVNLRRLRQLYEGRYLAQVEGSASFVEPKLKHIIEIGNMVEPPKAAAKPKIERVRPKKKKAA